MLKRKKNNYSATGQNNYPAVLIIPQGGTRMNLQSSSMADDPLFLVLVYIWVVKQYYFIEVLKGTPVRELVHILSGGFFQWVCQRIALI